MTDVVLGVDLGTSATKVIAVDDRLRVHGGTERHYPLHTGPDRQAVQDPELVLSASVDAIRHCGQSSMDSGLRVVGIGFSAAMHTLLAADRDGAPITPALSWADGRAADTARRIRTRHGPALHRATGTPVHPMSPLVKLAWFAEHEPRLVRRAAYWCGVKDFVLSRLTGRLVTDLSCASGTGLLDSATLGWSPPALAVAGVSEYQLPPLVPPTALLRLTSGATGLPTGLPVVAGGGDGPLANLGVGAARPGTAALSVGTSGALRVVRDAPGVDPDCRTFCYYLADGLWTTGGAVSNGGVVARWAADTFGVELPTLLADAAAVPPGAGDLLALPYLLGERAPYWEPDLPGLLLGLRAVHGRAEITRALVEGVAAQLAMVRDAVLAGGARFDVVRATGGALRSPLWTDALAAALDMPLEITDTANGSALGAAMLTWRALGRAPSLVEAVAPRASRVVQPDAAAARLAATRQPTYRRLCDILSDISA